MTIQHASADSARAKLQPDSMSSALWFIRNKLEDRYITGGSFPDLDDEIRSANPGYDASTWRTALTYAEADAPLEDDDPPEIYKASESWSLTEWLAGGVEMSPWKEYRRPPLTWTRKEIVVSGEDLKAYKKFEAIWNGTPLPIDSPISIVNAEEAEPEAVEWLWENRLAQGKVTILSGDPGGGKSTVSIYVAAKVTNGGEWPDGGWANYGSVIILSSEDAPKDTIIPRLMAAGADRSKVYIVRSVADGKKGKRKQRLFDLQTDLGKLSDLMRQIGDVALIVLDPITSYMGSGKDSHHTTDVRSVLDPVSEWAERHNVCVLGISHPPKASQSKAVNNVTGSLAFVGVARLVFCALEDPEKPGRHLMLRVKNNIGKPAPGLGYRIEGVTIREGIESSRIVWDGEPVTVTADEALAAAKKTDSGPTQLEKAKDWLRNFLAFGSQPQTVVEEEADRNFVSAKTLRRASEEMEIVKSKSREKNGKWLWSLPDD